MAFIQTDKRNLSGRSISVLLLACCCHVRASAQKNPAIAKDSVNTVKKESYYKKQRDLIDIALIIMHKDPDKRLDSTEGRNVRLHLSASPIFEYTLSTGFT